MALKVADAFIAVGADLTGYRAGLKTAEKETQSLGQQIKAALQGKYGGQGSLAGLVQDLKLGRSLTASLRGAAQGLGGTLKGLSVSALQTGLNGIKGVLGGLKGLANDVFKGFAIGVGIGSFQSFGRALSDLVAVIPNLIDKGREYIRMVDDVADATGATAAQTSQFIGTLLYLGVPVNGVINMLGQASRNLELMGPRLEALGIHVKNASGAWLNQIQILSNAREAMSQWGAGSKKVDILAREFGRGGLKTLVDFLNLTDDQFNRITADLKRSGLIITEEQRNMGEAAVREGARFENAWTGLGVALFTAVGPSIMAFFSNLTDWIVTNVEGIKKAISQAISYILGLVGSLVGMNGSLDSFSASIEAANAVTSPYSSDIIDLTDQLTKLGDETDSATDSTGAQRKAIQGSIDTIGKQEQALASLEKQQQKTADKAIAGLVAQLDAQEQLLTAEERAEQRADRALSLTRALTDAKRELFEAQAEAAKNDAAGTSSDKDTAAIVEAQRRVLDAQDAIRSERRQQGRDDRRAEIAAVKDYIASVQKLLADADNKKAALNTLRNREAVLTARQQAQLAAGDPQAAADTALKIEALKTAETRAQEQIRNGERGSALEKQKAQLQEELSNIASTAKSATEIKRAELQKQLQALIAQEAEWAKLTGKERDDTDLVTKALNQPNIGLKAAIDAARDAGIEMGEKWKAALKDITDAIGGVLGALNDIGSNKVFKILFVDAGAIFGSENAPSQSGGEAMGNTPPKTYGSKGAKSELGQILRDIWDQYIGNPLTGNVFPVNDSGGWAGKGLWMNQGKREYVLEPNLSEKLASFFSGSAMTPVAAGGSDAGYAPVVVRIPAPWTAAGFIDWVDGELWRKRKR